MDQIVPKATGAKIKLFKARPGDRVTFRREVGGECGFISKAQDDALHTAPMSAGEARLEILYLAHASGCRVRRVGISMDGPNTVETYEFSL